MMQQTQVSPMNNDEGNSSTLIMVMFMVFGIIGLCIGGFVMVTISQSMTANPQFNSSMSSMGGVASIVEITGDAMKLIPVLMIISFIGITISVLVNFGRNNESSERTFAGSRTYEEHGVQEPDQSNASPASPTSVEPTPVKIEVPVAPARSRWKSIDVVEESDRPAFERVQRMVMARRPR